ncbi:hypothetical protein ACIQ6Y_29925 [Streptomyces sp. NPDC096205]|uniref:hypothetical protein n=1 Tax=Streptomyces sp. NPDC096205 TaxID=3366081 RepID=UPI003825A403
MTCSAVLPGAAVRVMRAAVGRHALRVVLLVGGLFVVGLLWGGEARAAESAGAADSVAAVEVDAVSSDAVSAVIPAEGQTVASSDEQRLRMVGATAESAGKGFDGLNGLDGLAGFSEDAPALPYPSESPAPAPSLPSPSLPSPSLPSPSLPDPATGLTTLPDLSLLPSAQPESGLPGLDEVPVFPAPSGLPGADQLDVAPRPVVPQGFAAEALDRALSGAPTEADAAHHATGRGATLQGQGTFAELELTGASSRAADATAHPARGTDVPQGPLPADGGPVNGSAGDSGSPRHGDAQAVTVNDRASLWLWAGAAVRADVPGTRDRHRDIPVFPG